MYLVEEAGFTTAIFADTMSAVVDMAQSGTINEALAIYPVTGELVILINGI